MSQTKHGELPSITDASQELLDKATSCHISFKPEARSRHQKLIVCKEVLKNHILHHGYAFDAALEEMKKEFGVNEVPQDLVFFETPTKRMKKSMESEHNQEEPQKEGHHKNGDRKKGHHKGDQEGEHQQHQQHEAVRKAQTKKETPSKGNKKAHHTTAEKKDEKEEAGGEPEEATAPSNQKERKPSSTNIAEAEHIGGSSGEHGTTTTREEGEHHTKWEEVAIEENRKIVEMINEISGRYFRAGNPDKGKAYALASKIIRESKEVIDNGEEAHRKRGIGEHIAQHIDEFLQTGKVGVLEELRKTTD